MARYYTREIPYPDDEYEEVSELFSRHNRTGGELLVIMSIHRVRNDYLMKNFKDMETTYKLRYGHVRVERLFHGTETYNVRGILLNNFHISRAGTNLGCRFGAGVSFSAHASYASHYADEGDEGILILSEVLVSNIIEVEENLSHDQRTWLRKPPYIPGRWPLRYDTTAKNKNTMDVIVKFDENSFCPSHVVKFKRVPEPIVEFDNRRYYRAESSLPTQRDYIAEGGLYTQRVYRAESSIPTQRDYIAEGEGGLYTQRVYRAESSLPTQGDYRLLAKTVLGFLVIILLACTICAACACEPPYTCALCHAFTFGIFSCRR